MSLENKLRNRIFKALENVTKANSPHIYAHIQTTEGYQFIERQMIHKVIALKMEPEAAIGQLENHLDEMEG